MSAKHKAKGKNYRARSTIGGSDFFPTYHALTRILLDNVETFFDEESFLEPCAGDGSITKIVKEYFPRWSIREMDIEPRREGIEKADFLKMEEEKIYSVIISNFPFNLFHEFLTKCTKVCYREIYVLCPLDYLHGVERYHTFFKDGLNGFKLHKVWVFVRRPLFDKKFRPDGPMPTGATSFAWFHFTRRSLDWDPEIGWLDCNEDMGIPIEAEQVMMHDVLREDA